MRAQPVVPALLLAAALLSSPGAARSQTPLTLPRAVEIALEQNPDRKEALAGEREAEAGVSLARSALWPQLQFVESATRSNDPVYVFGTKLRQQRFTLADFDLARLNTPVPVNNFATRFQAQWNLFDFRQTWLRVDQAKQLHEAAGRELERTEQELVFRVVDAYYGLLLARKEQQVATDTVRTAQANLERTQARFDAGLVVESDLLSAQVNLSARQQEQIQADNAVAVARLHLNQELGIAADTDFEPAELLAERSLPLPPLAELEARALQQRPDLQQLELEEGAQEKSVAAAKAAYGPRVNLIASWEADNPAFFGNGGQNWLGGIQVEFDIFTGGAKRAELARQRARRDQVAARLDQTRSTVRTEIRQAYLDVDATRQQVEVARAAVGQARESLRILQNRYEAGLTTITDLLRAEEAANRSQTQYWGAVYRWQISYANLELAAGSLGASSPVVVTP